ncbi:MAG: hypothetical protein R3E08_09485 [Thiotrichaceae bacterium]
MTTGLENRNAINKINDPGDFFNTDLWMWQKPCVANSLNLPNLSTPLLRHAKDSSEWRFEAALLTIGGNEDWTEDCCGQDCPIGDGVIPERFPVKDGTTLWMNFYQVHADDPGKVSI